MKRLKIYLETSVWNFLVAEDSAEKKRITERLFSEINEGKYEIFISDFVMDEILRASEHRKSLLLELIKRYGPERLTINQDSEYLANRYKESNIIPERFETDLFHISIAVVYNIDILVSWNMKHIVKYKTKVGVNTVNLAQDFKSIELLTPEELIDDD